MELGEKHKLLYETFLGVKSRYGNTHIEEYHKNNRVHNFYEIYINFMDYLDKEITSNFKLALENSADLGITWGKDPSYR